MRICSSVNFFLAIGYSAAFTFPKTYRSVSAFSPITNPTKSDWGIKQFTAYLGEDRVKWQDYDASLLMQKNGFPGPILIDQGSADQFWDLLRPNAISEAMIEKKTNRCIPNSRRL